jgi:hypothetical protein
VNSTENGVDNYYWPTVAATHKYLADLDFTSRLDPRGFVIFTHPTNDCWFAFRNRGPEEPAREVELLQMKVQLTYRGFVTDEEFAQFWDQRNPRILRPAQPTA